jgi:hypothetical protein
MLLWNRLFYSISYNMLSKCSVKDCVSGVCVCVCVFVLQVFLNTALLNIVNGNPESETTDLKK